MRRVAVTGAAARVGTLLRPLLSTDRTGRFEAGTVITFDVDADGLSPFRFAKQSS